MSGSDPTAALLAELDQALSTIEFLHGCLTDPVYSYEYPEQTVARIERLRAITANAPQCTAGLSASHPPGVCPIHNEDMMAARAALASEPAA